VAADGLDPADGLRLVAARGRIMQEAGGGGMIAVRVRGDRGPVEEVAAATGLTIANDNAPDQLVLSGALDALDRAEESLRERKVRAKRLPVGGAFHSPLMEPAIAPYREVVEGIDFREPRVPVFSCVTAAPFEDVREQLVAALTHPVRWTGVMSALRDAGATSYVETGPGRVLTNLVRKSLDGVQADAPLAMEAASA
jgi:[acyl-carrier-protein] S-malonyltransferase